MGSHYYLIYSPIISPCSVIGLHHAELAVWLFGPRLVLDISDVMVMDGHDDRTVDQQRRGFTSFDSPVFIHQSLV